MGRPLRKIDPEQVKALAVIGCTKSEIARMLGCNESIIRRRFAEIFELGDSLGKTQLRRKQHKRAVEDESDSMLMFLGKHRLGQDDKTRVELTGKDGAPLYAEPAPIGEGLKILESLGYVRAIAVPTGDPALSAQSDALTNGIPPAG
jgi:hypothetical protein